MTINTTTNTISHASDGVQTVFPYNFRIDDETHAKVYVDDVEQSTGWTIDGIGGDAGGNVTFATAPAEGTVTIQRQVPITQEVDYDPYGPFPSQTHEGALDKLTMITQQLQEQVSRATLAPVSDDGTTDYTLPTYDAGKFLQWDIIEKKLVNGTIPDAAVPVDAIYDNVASMTGFNLAAGQYVKTKGYYTPGDGGGAEYLIEGPGTADEWGDHTLGNGNIARLQRTFLIGEQFGLKGDNTTDNGDAFEAVVAASNAAGMPFFLTRKGQYLTSKPLVFNESGAGIIAPGSDPKNEAVTEAHNFTIRATAAMDSLITLTSPDDANEHKRYGMVVRGFHLDCNALADTGIKLLSVNHCEVVNLSIRYPAAQGVYIGTVANLGEAASPQQNWLHQIHVQAYTSDGVDPVINSAHGFVFDGMQPGQAAGNTSLNTFGMLKATHKDGNGFDFRNCDNNVVMHVVAYGRPSATGKGVAFHGSDDGDNYVARANIILKCTSSQGGIYAYGTDTYAYPSRNNNVLGIDSDNGTQLPTLETDATCFAERTDNYRNLVYTTRAGAFSNNVWGLQQLLNRKDPHALQVAGSSNQISMYDAVQDDFWYIEVAAPDLRIRGENGGWLTLRANGHAALPAFNPDTATADDAATVGHVNYLIGAVATFTELEDINSAINTTNKFTGKKCWSSTDNRPVYAIGPNPEDPWYYADGTVANSPS